MGLIFAKVPLTPRQLIESQLHQEVGEKLWAIDSAWAVHLQWCAARLLGTVEPDNASIPPLDKLAPDAPFAEHTAYSPKQLLSL